MRLLFLVFMGTLTLPVLADSTAPIAAEVTLVPAEQKRLGIATSTLVERRDQASTVGYARVLDVGPWAALEAELEGAHAAVETSAAEVTRLTRLAAADQSASRQAVEAARALAAADGARLRLAERRLRLEWGSAIAQLEDRQRAKIIDDIGTGKAALLRIDTLDETTLPGPAQTSLSLRTTLPGEMTLDGKPLGRAPTVDPRLQTAGLYLLTYARSVSQLKPGLVFSVSFSTAVQEVGVILPGSALLRLDGATWVYVGTDHNRYRRRAISGGRSLADGWFVSEGFKPGEEIVAIGAGSALAVERGSTADTEAQ